ncbi:ABC transporter substrate-binding protein [Synechococcus sp. CS-1332]|uniref:ABC transporter substrate-binding protein n=1 Tax=Synechococcus sp. CS-1332 TaxID=2847972 RepID=UPI00223BB831|nr:ABC transporter substrate-binding protein [Synechococcus sp. CS-1332]MCT0208895.1 ABC transporter substrate-binding protein [Synechococcus sp. CS-1332]
MDPGASEAHPPGRAPRDRRYRLARIALLGPLLLAIAMGCQRQPPRLILAVNPWPGFSYFALAKAGAHYDSRRLNLDLRIFADMGGSMQAYVSGRAQAIATTTIDVVTICGLAPERCPVIVYVIDESRGADQLLARKGVQGVEGLVGRPIAVERGSLAPYLLARAFETKGLPAPSPSQLRFLPASSWAAALREGRVAAVVSYPPRSEMLLRSQPLQTLFTSRQLPYEILDVLAVEPEFLHVHPEAVQALVKGWQKVRAEESQQQATVRQEMASHLGLGSTMAPAMGSGIRYPGLQEQYELLNPLQNNLPPLLEKIRQVLYANRVIPANTPLPATVDSIARDLARGE